MSEKPQRTQTGEQEDLLDQIITQSLERMNAPAKAAVAAEVPEAVSPAPTQKGSVETDPPTGRKRRQSAVYLYLLILFGAAFLMLLLAYFVQQRSSEDAYNDLHNTMTLSRQELLAEIKELEDKNAALVEQIAALMDRNDSLMNENKRVKDSFSTLNSEIAQLKQQNEEATRELNSMSYQYIITQSELHGWQSFWMLERYYQVGDYETCATMLLLSATGEESFTVPNAVVWRYEEIVQAVIDAGILDEDYRQHPEDYDNTVLAR